MPYGQAPAQATPEVLQALIDCLSDDDWDVRANAAEALDNLGKQTDIVAPQLAN